MARFACCIFICLLDLVELSLENNLLCFNAAVGPDIADTLPEINFLHKGRIASVRQRYLAGRKATLNKEGMNGPLQAVYQR
jgi:hypothetical protein